MENFSKKAFEIYDPLNVCLNNDLAFADNYYDVTYCTEAVYRLDQVLVHVMNSLIEQQNYKCGWKEQQQRSRNLISTSIFIMENIHVQVLWETIDKQRKWPHQFICSR